MKKIYLASAILFGMLSCSSDDDSIPENVKEEETETVVEETAYSFGLRDGNKWIYHHYRRVGNTENFVFMDKVEKITVIGDEEINNKTYKKLEITMEEEAKETVVEYRFYRDSLGYKVDEKGIISLSSENKEKHYLFTIGADAVKVFGELQDENKMISTELGSFDCMNFQLTGKNGVDEDFMGKTNMYFTKKEGLIKGEISSATGEIHSFEKRLQIMIIN